MKVFPQENYFSNGSILKMVPCCSLLDPGHLWWGGREVAMGVLSPEKINQSHGLQAAPKTGFKAYEYYGIS